MSLPPVSHGHAVSTARLAARQNTLHTAQVPSMAVCVNVRLGTSVTAVPGLPWWGAGSVPALLIFAAASCPAGLGAYPRPAGWCRHILAGLLVLDFAWCHLHRAHCQPTCKYLTGRIWMATAALVILLPLFVMADPGEGAVKAIIILQNIVLGGFLAMLFWIFRSAPLVSGACQMSCSSVAPPICFA